MPKKAGKWKNTLIAPIIHTTVTLNSTLPRQCGLLECVCHNLFFVPGMNRYVGTNIKRPTLPLLICVP